MVWQNVGWASLVAPFLAKTLPAEQEMWASALGWEDSLEKRMASHSSLLAWKNPMDRGAWGATVHRVTKSQTRLSTHTYAVEFTVQHPNL